MKKSKKSIYKRTWFFYKGALIIKAPKIVDLMMIASRTHPSKRLEACVFLPGIVFVDSSKNFVHYLCNHEAIHVRQIWECMFLTAMVTMFCTELPVYVEAPLVLMSYWILYLTDFVIIRAFLGHHDSYLLSAFEQEAWLHESDRNYLKITRRIPYIWVWYMIKHIFLFSKAYRVLRLRRLVHIRVTRKQHLYWRRKKNKTLRNWSKTYLEQLSN